LIAIISSIMLIYLISQFFEVEFVF
jgi:hypothetical protein